MAGSAATAPTLDAVRTLRSSLLLVPAALSAGHAFGYLLAGQGHDPSGSSRSSSGRWCP